jgi:hypothetical protein
MALGLAPCCLDVAEGQTAPAGNSRIELGMGWLIQSSAKVTEMGDVISSNSFQPREWYPSIVPSTFRRKLPGGAKSQVKVDGWDIA